MVKEPQKEYVSWEQVEQYVHQLKKHCDSIGFKPKGIYGPARGGIPYAVIAADVFGVPLLASHCDKCIVIDDIADSGVTLSRYKSNVSHLNKQFVSTMYYKEGSIVKPDFYTHEKGDKWVVFPNEQVSAHKDEMDKLQQQVTKQKTGNINVNWQQVDGFSYIVQKYCETGKKKFNGVYPVPNGGEIMAVTLSNVLDLPLLSAPCEGCLVIGDIIKNNDQCKDYSTAAMFGEKSDRGEYERKNSTALFQVEHPERIVMPYKKCEAMRKQRTKEEELKGN